MTDRHAGYVVTLSEDIREDDAEAIINAIRMVKGVINVRPIVSNVELMIAEDRTDQEWREKIRQLLLNRSR